MGHYDEQYEASAREERERKLIEARALASKLKIPILGNSSFNPPLGVCATCAKAVYIIPNWGCRDYRCPHKP